MKKIKIADAPNTAIDWLVAKAENMEVTIRGSYLMKFHKPLPGKRKAPPPTFWEPTADPAQAWPIIERKHINVAYIDEDEWECWIGEHEPESGPTSLVAAMRCFCVSRYGEEAEVPEELLHG